MRIRLRVAFVLLRAKLALAVDEIWCGFSILCCPVPLQVSGCRLVSTLSPTVNACDSAFYNMPRNEPLQFDPYIQLTRLHFHLFSAGVLFIYFGVKWHRFQMDYRRSYDLP